MNWKLYFEVSFAQKRQSSGGTPFAAALAEHIATCKMVIGCRLVLYEFPCLYVDDLIVSFMSSG